MKKLILILIHCISTLLLSFSGILIYIVCFIEWENCTNEQEMSPFTIFENIWENKN
ncbi:MAG: hypothetical protein WC827_03615 [Candidatus Paceibacterota bacterium]|jgi:hypothetical protein